MTLAAAGSLLIVLGVVVLCTALALPLVALLRRPPARATLTPPRRRQRMAAI